MSPNFHTKRDNFSTGNQSTVQSLAPDFHISHSSNYGIATDLVKKALGHDKNAVTEQDVSNSAQDRQKLMMYVHLCD